MFLGLFIKVALNNLCSKK